MKNIKNLIVAIFIITLSMNSCNEDFLDMVPLDQISEAVYFKKTSDLKLYMNQFYDPDYRLLEYFRRGNDDYSELIFIADMNSDNFISTGVDDRLNGTRTVPASGGDWSYTNVRRVNYFLDNYKKCEDSFNLYKHYVGEAYFFRALIYFKLVREYGDVLWYDKVLSTNSEELYDAKTPRNIVIDHIIADLDSAATYMVGVSVDGGNRLDRWSALLVQSRIALFEGTWEKYHAGTVFGVQNPNPDKYFNIAVNAASEIINSNKFAIYTTGKPQEDYYQLFDTHDYSGNKEVILWKKYSKALGIINQRMVLGTRPNQRGITKELADSYLCSDGFPISVSSLFKGYNTIDNESQNRDPRYKQTIFTPDAPYAYSGTVYNNWGEGVFSKLFTTSDLSTPTCYVRRKGTTYNLNHQNLNGEEEPIIYYLYSEVLLNYAEAKAELGTITQTDIDISIKPLRDRVGMPNLVLSSIVTDPDWDFPTLSPVINEIRRERRVELACFGLRWYDIARWAAADELIVGKRPKGAKFGSSFPLNPFPNDSQGFMDPLKASVPNGYGFVLGRDYLSPLPQDQLTLNSNLTQNPGW